ncbi:uncharacterized protein LOC132603283 isoform X3 [Lycium barbarum]|uniref:uncharacterized protein LOC132603283 isoform X3 n=1 Tax=Lycium barbarum TaxID=112863 RepID=UPI00293E5B77|nr:uncharacterized protein LOC132603283 isoform X3 [Lycium barbarum]
MIAASHHRRLPVTVAACQSPSPPSLPSTAVSVHSQPFEVYMLKVEGIAFRFLPDPVQIKNAMEDVSSSCASKVMLYIHLHVIVSRESKLLKASDVKTGFDGVPVFQRRSRFTKEIQNI